MAESRSREKSPVAQDRKHRRRIVFYTFLAIFTLLFVYLLTSYLDHKKRGEKWQPLAFLFGTTAAPTLPIAPTVPIDVLISIADDTSPRTTAASLPPITKHVYTTAVPITSEAETIPVITEPESSPIESTEEPTEEETTTEEPTTEEPTTEPTTEEPTTPEPTTEPTTPEPVTEEPTTEEPTTEVPFDDTDLAAHLEAAGMDEEALQGSQLVIVRCYGGSRCTLSFFEKTENGWELSAALPAANGMIGEDGLSAEKLPGDKVTPAGYFSLGPAYGMLAPVGIDTIDYHQFQSGDVWVTDPSSAYYNTLQNDHDHAADWKESISLLTQDETYKYAVLVCHNVPEADPARGCAVFLNVSSGEATDGSIGLKEVTLFTLLQWLNGEADPHILLYSAN